MLLPQVKELLKQYTEEDLTYCGKNSPSSEVAG